MFHGAASQEPSQLPKDFLVMHSIYFCVRLHQIFLLSAYKKLVTKIWFLKAIILHALKCGGLELFNIKPSEFLFFPKYCFASLSVSKVLFNLGIVPCWGLCEY